MANELTLSLSLAFDKTVKDSFTFAAAKFNVSGSDYIKSSKSVPTTAGGVVIPLGSLSGTLGFFAFVNRGANLITILDAVSGNALLDLKPGEATVGRFASSITAPAWIATGSASRVEYMILPD